MYDAVVLSSGSMSGICLLGALERGCETGLVVRTRVRLWMGSSAGAMVAVLISCGITFRDIREFCFACTQISVYNPSISMLTSRMGLDRGKLLMRQIRKLLDRHGCHARMTFHDWYKRNGNDLRITATDLVSRRLVVCSRETTPDMPVLKALRASISVPIAFTPVKYQGRLLVDGALTGKIPIDSVPSHFRPIGFCMWDAYNSRDIPIDGWLTYLPALMRTAYSEVTHLRIENSSAPVVGIRCTHNPSDLSILKDIGLISDLWDQGREALDAFIRGEKFDTRLMS